MYPCLLRGQDSEDASKSAWLIDQITERRKALKQPTNSMSIQPWRLAIGLGYENGNRFTAMDSYTGNWRRLYSLIEIGRAHV